MASCGRAESGGEQPLGKRSAFMINDPWQSQFMTTSRNLPVNTEQRKVTNYRDLLVWSKAMDLVEVCYKLSARFPQSETYGLGNQLRRAAVSVPANIAEGHGRRNLGEYIQHLSIANGSLKEVETHLLISVRLKYIGKDESDAAFAVCEQIGKMLAGLRHKLRQRQAHIRIVDR